MRRITLLFTALLLVFLSGCVSEQKYETDILELEQDLAEIKQDKEELYAQYQTLEGIIYSSQYTIDSQIVELLEEVTTHLATIDDLNSSILLLEADLLEATTDYNTAVDDIAVLNSYIEEVDSDIQELETYILELEENYEALLLLLEEVPEVYSFTHINGHGYEADYTYSILFEYNLRDYIKYQITYQSCTCRNADSNYWQVAYVEINKFTNDIRFISYDEEPGGHYSPGSWGDSNPTPAGKTPEDFEADFIPWLIGKSLSDLEGISVFTNVDYFGIQNTTNIPEQALIDSFAGSSVTTNNMIRVMKELLAYHEE